MKHKIGKFVALFVHMRSKNFIVLSVTAVTDDVVLNQFNYR